MHGVADLFPESKQPEALGADAVPYFWSTFFAIYPAKHDLPRLVRWQRSICGQGSAPIALTRPELLHVSVAECGNPKQKRQPWPDVLAEAVRHFSFPAFDMVFDSVARFGKDGGACVAIADAASQETFARLRVAVADAQRHAGIFISRARHAAHLTLGYGEGSPEERRNVELLTMRVVAVEFVASETGKSRHEHLERWPLSDE